MAEDTHDQQPATESQAFLLFTAFGPSNAGWGDMADVLACGANPARAAATSSWCGAEPADDSVAAAID